MFKRTVLQWVWLCGALSVGLIGCDDEDNEGPGCAADTDCARGEVCESGACQIIPCDTIAACPGSGRTCLSGVNQCSAKECADQRDGVELTCPPTRSTCLESGPFQKSCVAVVSCQTANECASAGLDDGFACCGGECRTDCPDMLVTPDMGAEDMGVTPDEGVETDMGPDEDMGPPQVLGLCSPCQSADECVAGLGEGARCTALGADGAFCASACTGPEDCPAGYRCEANGLNLCLPEGLRCVDCLRNPCADGLVCDTQTGECVDPKGPCGPCTDDTGCQDGLRCAEVENGRFCLQPCPDGMCPEGLACEAGICQPESGRCDPCGGRCEGEAPYCVEATGQCGQCGPGVPCPEGLNCDLANNVCVESEGCLGDVDCQNPDLSVCFNGMCVACLQDTDCPPRNACNAQQQCEPDPCRGVECQRGSECNPATGRCDPGCQAAADCADPMTMSCNAETGQCYLNNGTCDLGGGDAVCAPGSICTPGLDPNLGVCDCELQDPMNPMSPQRRACHTGQMCTQFLPDLPGCCGGCGIF
jgi:hypothetical protein